MSNAQYIQGHIMRQFVDRRKIKIPAEDLPKHRVKIVKRQLKDVAIGFFIGVISWGFILYLLYNNQ